MTVFPLQSVPARSAVDPSTVVMSVWGALLGIGFASVIIAGFVAKKIENIHRPTYTKAFVAQMLIGFVSSAGFAVFGFYLQAPLVVALGLAYSVIPIAVYKIVFGAMWREAALIWVAVTVFQVGIGFGLSVAGVVSFEAFASFA